MQGEKEKILPNNREQRRRKVAKLETYLYNVVLAIKMKTEKQKKHEYNKEKAGDLQ